MTERIDLQCELNRLKSQPASAAESGELPPLDVVSSYDPKTAPRDYWTLIYDCAQRDPRAVDLLNGRQAIQLIDQLRSALAEIAALRAQLEAKEAR